VGLIVDTCEFIALERAGGSPSDIIAVYGTSELYAISAITVAELRHGVRRANNPARMELRQRFLDAVIDNFAVFPLDTNTALRLGDLDAAMQILGKKRELPDLVVAATAIELDYAVATKNFKHFDGIPGIRIAVAVRLT
jgi:predicted nucleic acid-binding protein